MAHGLNMVFETLEQVIAAPAGWLYGWPVAVLGVAGRGARGGGQVRRSFMKASAARARATKLAGVADRRLLTLLSPGRDVGDFFNNTQ